MELSEHTFLVGEIKKRRFACFARKKSSHRGPLCLSLSLLGVFAFAVNKAYIKRREKSWVFPWFMFFLCHSINEV